MCTASLVDSYAAMANTAEEHWRLAAAHPLYAALLEKALAEVARQQIAQLEAIAQVSERLPLHQSSLSWQQRAPLVQRSLQGRLQCETLAQQRQPRKPCACRVVAGTDNCMASERGSV